MKFVIAAPVGVQLYEFISGKIPFMVSSMRDRRKLCLLLSLVLACLGLYGCAGSGNATPGTGKGGGKKGGGGGDVPVTVVKVERKDVPVDIQVIGNVEAYSAIA